MFDELLTATTDMAVLSGVLGCRTLRRSVQVRLGFDLGFGISDLGFLSTIDDIELSNSDIAICSLVQTNFSASFQSAIRNPQSSTRWHAHLRGLGTPIHETSGLRCQLCQIGFSLKGERISFSLVSDLSGVLEQYARGNLGFRFSELGPTRKRKLLLIRIVGTQKRCQRKNKKESPTTV